tara:strand:- start:466 stop:1053 length:588 start_codon:yes stop_codon:yes gene_type:complete
MASSAGCAPADGLDGAGIARAVIADAVHKIAELAAACPVDVEAVAAVAFAHGDKAFAETVRAGIASLRHTREKSDVAIATLQTKYPTTAMLDAITAATAEPVISREAGTVTAGTKVFVTSNGELLVDIWRIRNPGDALVTAFCDGLRTTQGDLADPDDFLAFFDLSVPNAFVREHVGKIQKALEAVASQCTPRQL